MTIYTVCAVFLIWLCSGLTISGWLLAYHRRGWTYPETQSDRWFALTMGAIGGVTGPFGVVVVFFLTEGAKHGWTLRLRPKNR